MSFEFLRLRAENFVLYENLDIKFKELEGNLIFITGKNLDVSGTDSNCSGKTLIGDIFTDLLFDKTIRRHSQGSFIGKFNKWCSSSIWIRDTISKKKYLIKKFRNHPKHGDKLFFLEYTKGTKKTLSRKKKADTYKRIWKVFGLNWRTFKNRNYFGQEDPERFLRVTDAKKAEIIIDIQDLSDLQKAKKLSNDNLKDIKKKEEICEAELKFLLERIVLVESLKDTAETKRKQALSDAEEAIKQTKKTIAKKRKFIDAYGPVHSSIEVVKKEIKEGNDKTKEADKLLKKLHILKIKSSDFEIKIAFETERGERLTDEISRAKKEIVDLKKQVVTICSKCGAKLTKERLVKSIKTLKSEAKESFEKRDASDHQAISFKDVQFETEGKISKIEKALKVLAPIIEARIALIDDLKVLREKDAQIAILDVEIEGLMKYGKRIKEEVDELEKDDYLLSLTLESVACREQNKGKEKELRILRRKKAKNEFSKAVFDKTIRNLFDGFLDNLNHYSNIFLDDLCDNDISVAFSSKTERASKKVVDEINVLVSVDGAKPREFRTYSGGERGRVELVTQLVLFSSAESNFPFLFLDEPFTSIDKTGRERMINLLQSVSEEGNKVFVVSNKNVPSGYGSMLEVERKDGKAVINYV